MHQRGLLETFRQFHRKAGTERHQQRADLAGHHVVHIQRFVVQRQQRRQQARAFAAGESQISHHLALAGLHTPGLEQGHQIGLPGRTAAERILQIRLLVEVGIAVDERDDLAAAQHKLVDGVFSRLHDVARMDDQQHLDVVIDLGRGEIHLAHVEYALQFRSQHPRIGRLLFFHRIERAAEYRQIAHDADHRLFRLADLRDRARDVVLEQALAVRRQHRDRSLLVEEGHRQAEVELLAGVGHLPFDVVQRRGFFGVGVRLGVELLDDDLAVGSRLEFIQHVFDAAGEGLQARRHRGAALRVIKADPHRRFELGEDRTRAFGQRVNTPFGQVDAGIERAENEIGRNQDQRQRENAAGRIHQGLKILVFHGLIFRNIIPHAGCG